MRDPTRRPTGQPIFELTSGEAVVIGNIIDELGRLTATRLRPASRIKRDGLDEVAGVLAYFRARGRSI